MLLTALDWIALHEYIHAVMNYLWFDRLRAYVKIIYARPIKLKIPSSIKSVKFILNHLVVIAYHVKTQGIYFITGTAN